MNKFLQLCNTVFQHTVRQEIIRHNTWPFHKQSSPLENTFKLTSITGD